VNNILEAYRRFSGTPLDRALAALVGCVCVVGPPLLLGYWGVIYALIVVILMQMLDLWKTRNRKEVRHVA
jgi:hypothetical protein